MIKFTEPNKENLPEFIFELQYRIKQTTTKQTNHETGLRAWL